MVGPVPSEWNFLRPTDGERFVGIYKGNDFSGTFANCKNQKIDVKCPIS